MWTPIVLLTLAADPATLDSRFTAQAPPMTARLTGPWTSAPLVTAERDRFGKPLPEARTEIRSLWTPTHLYFLFTARYESMYLKPNPAIENETWGLWEYDVVEVFIGHDLERIHIYKEFEVSPRGEWVDLDVDKSRKGREVDWYWNAGMRTKTFIDEAAKTWSCVIELPWKSIDTRTPGEGNQLRLNLYRIEGGPDPRKYITWQPVDSPSFHTPEKFGRLRLIR